MGLNRLALVLFGIAGALCGGIAPRAAAQRAVQDAPPIYGTLSLRPGFTPDPTIVVGVGGGPVSLSAVHPDCRGYAGQAPNHVVMAQEFFRFLAVMVDAEYDSTLMVQTPDGRLFCNDDTDGLQPRVEISSPPGPIRIWVGSYSSSAGGPYRLGFSNSPGVRSVHLRTARPGVAVAPPPPSGIVPSGASRYGNVVVRSRMVPDPTIVTGQAGGPIPADSVDPSCRGWITPEPSHVVMAQSSFGNLRFVVSAEEDTTLLVQYPDGRFVCNDDGGGGLNPLVEAATGPGPIRVWVGTFSQGRTLPYVLGLTENPGITYAMLPRAGGGGVVVTPPPTLQQPPPEPPPVTMTVVDLQPRIPVTLFGPGMTTATLAVWSPRGGPRIQIRVTPTGGTLAIGANVGDRQVPLMTVPAEIARDAVVTVTQRPDQRILVRAERPPASADAGAQMLLLVRWDAAAGAPQIAEQWFGTFRDRAPRWAR